MVRDSARVHLIIHGNNYCSIWGRVLYNKGKHNEHSQGRANFLRNSVHAICTGFVIKINFKLLWQFLWKA